VRNLIYFFCEDKQPNSKDAVARHFTDRFYSPFDGICPQEKTQGVYGKINKQITHITYDSTEIEAEKISFDDRKNLYDMIIKEIRNFQEHIKSPYDVFKQRYAGLFQGAQTGPVGSKSSGYRPPPWLNRDLCRVKVRRGRGR
jgi:hypothetical protein